MLLSSQEVLARLQKPAATVSLQMGRALERRHRLHIEGDKALLWEFLKNCRPDDLISETEYNELQKIIKAGTKPIYSSLSNITSKVFTAAGTTRYYDFARPNLQEDWQDYLKGYSKPGLYRTLEKKWFSAAQVGFQGLFLVDLPATPEAGLPRPYFRYVPSAEVFDLEVEDDTVEYAVLQADGEDGAVEYYCFDDQYCHRARQKSGDWFYLKEETTQHGLGYTPLCMVTNRKPELARPVVRTSFVSESLELADVYLVDFNNLQRGKQKHVFQKFWSYGVRCEHIAVGKGCEGTVDYVPPTSCNSGYLYYESGKQVCPRCKGQGRYIPTGPDKAYILEVPRQGDPPITPPGGYIEPELKSVEFIAKELETNERKIEKAVLGKEGILTQQTKVETAAGKDQDMGPVYDRLAAVSEDLEGVEKFVLDTMARLRYGDAYRDAQITRGRRYQVKSASQLEAEYAAAKAAGLDESSLYPYLEDIIYTKWAGDPMELERNLLKLQLTPFPTCTIAEARADGVATSYDLGIKRYLNDFVARFEEDNGSILEFGSLLAPAEKLKRIREQFKLYLKDKQDGKEEFTFLAPVNAAPAVEPVGV